MTDHNTWRELRKERQESPVYRAEYVRTRQAYEIGRKVRALREEHGLTQTELAQRMGSTQSVIARLEGGGAEPRYELLERIGRALNSDLEVSFRPHQKEAPIEHGAGRTASA